MQAFLKDAQSIKLPKGSKVFEPGSVCEQFVILKTGTIRVDLITKSGKPVVLYRFGAGETCILTTSCILSGDLLCGEATVEEEAEAYVFPLSSFQKNMDTSAEFRTLVFQSFAERLSLMMSKIEEITSEPIETRLAARLLSKKNRQGIIETTHDELASDIGTVREVITRKLKEWDKLGLIKKERGKITITNLRELKAFSSTM